MSYAGWNKSRQAKSAAPKRGGDKALNRRFRLTLPPFLRTYAGTLAFTVAAIAVATWFYWPSPAEEEDITVDKFGRRVHLDRNSRRKSQSPRDAVREAMKSVKLPKKARKRPPKPMFKVMFDHLKPADKRLAEKVQSALDEENLASLIAASEQAMKSENPEVRQHTVEALGWFGPEALPELTGAMADPDPDVSQAAENAWEVGLADVEDPASKIEIAAATMATLANPEHLITIGGQFTGAVAEYVDMEENEAVAAERRLAVVQLLADIIDGEVPKACSDGAKEAYEDVTGEAWTGIEAAEAYLCEQYDYEGAAANASAESTDGETGEGESADAEAVAY